MPTNYQFFGRLDRFLKHKKCIDERPLENDFSELKIKKIQNSILRKWKSYQHIDRNVLKVIEYILINKTIFKSYIFIVKQ